jgi:hypothetical protein
MKKIHDKHQYTFAVSTGHLVRAAQSEIQADKGCCGVENTKQMRSKPTHPEAGY